MTERPPIFGRATELAALVEWVGAGRVRGAFALVEGEGGIGKSSLIAAAADALEAEGVTVWSAAAHEHDRRPLAALSALLPGITAAPPARADRPAGFAIWTGADAGYEVIDEVIDAIESRADQPLTIMLDDAQWADGVTLAALRAVARRRADWPVSVVVGRRPHPSSAALEGLVADWRAFGSLELRLGPLSEPAVAQLVRFLTGSEPDDALRALVARAAGNPFFIHQIVTVLSGLGGSAVPDTLVLTGGFRDSVLQWLGALDIDTIGLLQFAAILGPLIDVESLATLRGAPVGALLRPLRQCVRMGALRGDGDQFTFTHDIVRETIYDDMQESTRTALHREAGRLLMAHGASPFEFARHLALGTERGDPRGVAELRRTAAELIETEPDAARTLLERARDLQVGPLSAVDSLDLARALDGLGATVAAEEVARAALLRGDGDPVTTARLDALLAIAAIVRGDRPDAAAAVLERAAAVSGLADREVADFLTDAALARLLSGEFDQAGSLAEQAQASAPGASGSALAAGVNAWIASFAGDTTRAVDQVERMLRAAATLTANDPAFAIASFFAGMVYLDCDRLVDGVRVFQTGRNRAASTGANWALPLYHQGVGAGFFLGGDWSAAQAELEAGLTISADMSAVHGDLYARAILALIAIGRDEVELAREQLAIADDLLAHGAPPLGLIWLELARGLLAELDGDVAGALEVLSGAWDLDVALGIRNDLGSLAPDLVRIALTLGDRPRAEAVCAELVALTQEYPATPVRGVAAWCSALLSERLEDFDDAIGELSASEHLLDLAAASLDRALARPNGLEADDDARRAFEIWWRAEAFGRLHRAERRLVGAGRSVPPAPVSDVWSRLSDVERGIAESVAAGRTNREVGAALFISHRTVETHLKHMFRKLGVRNRVELARTVAARSAAAGPAAG
jgi:ATP/maltotriose-dependent transcriptional regulator MalT